MLKCIASVAKLAFWLTKELICIYWYAQFLDTDNSEVKVWVRQKLCEVGQRGKMEDISNTIDNKNKTKQNTHTHTNTQISSQIKSQVVTPKRE